MTTSKLDPDTLLYAARNLTAAFGQPDLWWVFYDLMRGKPPRRPVPPTLQRELLRFAHADCTGE